MARRKQSQRWWNEIVDSSSIGSCPQVLDLEGWSLLDRLKRGGRILCIGDSIVRKSWERCRELSDRSIDSGCHAKVVSVLLLAEQIWHWNFESPQDVRWNILNYDNYHCHHRSTWLTRVELNTEGVAECPTVLQLNRVHRQKLSVFYFRFRQRLEHPKSHFSDDECTFLSRIHFATNPWTRWPPSPWEPKHSKPLSVWSNGMSPGN